jgi:hypothetical protein
VIIDLSTVQPNIASERWYPLTDESLGDIKLQVASDQRKNLKNRKST